jgi:hypothetical protein
VPHTASIRHGSNEPPASRRAALHRGTAAELDVRLKPMSHPVLGTGPACVSRCGRRRSSMPWEGIRTGSDRCSSTRRNSLRTSHVRCPCSRG